jgi:PAS domain-containing protein
MCSAGPETSNSGSESDLRCEAAALREREELLRQQFAELESIYAAAPVGLAVISPDLRIIRVNERMAEMDGQPVAAHPGRTIRDLAPDFADLLEPIVRRVLATGEPIRDLEIEGESPTRPGERRTWIGQWFPQTTRAEQSSGSISSRRM